VYDTTERPLIDITPDDALLHQTLGLRSAGSYKNVAFLAGPTPTGAIGVGEGINLFAFMADTRARQPWPITSTSGPSAFSAGGGSESTGKPRRSSMG
jgi:hypothetical protein